MLSSLFPDKYLPLSVRSPPPLSRCDDLLQEMVANGNLTGKRTTRPRSLEHRLRRQCRRSSRQ
jgi:hypothetical protein